MIECVIFGEKDLTSSMGSGTTEILYMEAELRRPILPTTRKDSQYLLPAQKSLVPSTVFQVLAISSR